MLAIRLKRMGSTHRPYYRIVVNENDRRPRGKFIEEIGYYHPMSPEKTVQIDAERAHFWLDRGAHASNTVASLIKKHAPKPQA